MDVQQMRMVAVLVWAVAIVLFIIGAYSDEDANELFGWGFALLTGGFLVEHLPGWRPGKRE